MRRSPGATALFSTAPFIMLALASMVAPRPLAAATRVEEVRFDRAALAIEARADGAVAVRYPRATPAPAGAPDLPWVPVWIEVPAGMRVTGVSAAPGGVAKQPDVRVAPVAPDARGDETPRAALADPAIYGSAGLYPATWARLASEGTLRGHAVACVLVAPARWDVGSGTLETASAVTVTLLLEPGRPTGVAEPLVRRRVVAEIEARFEDGAAALIRGFARAAATEDLGQESALGIGDVGNGPAGPGPYQPTFRPSLDGSAVEYVIVTGSALEPEFQRLADWKTRKGVQAAVRTVEWIDQTYPNGVDRAERIRFFLRDAYQNWGTLFVLLGGDTDIVPPRYAQMIVYEGEQIPADYYYSCLDGNWNADGDSRFGESLTAGFSDDIDLAFEVHVGRAPVSTVAEAQAFVNKTLTYEQTPPAGARYPASFIALAERLFSDQHGADIAEEAIASLPPWMRVVRGYEESASYPGSIELSRQTAIDSINAGFGIIHHVGHGYRNTMSVGSGTLNNSDADALVNGSRNSVVFAINCSSASIDFNSIGERFVKNANGGSIAYIGTSRLAFVSPSRVFQNEWYATIFDSTSAYGKNLGAATSFARLALVPNSEYDSGTRWNLLATTLLGDPEVDLYTNAAVPIAVTHPASVALGSAPITVTVTAGGSPVAGASVTLRKTAETYVRGITGANGQAQLAVGAQTTGTLALTVHKSYYRPYLATVNVTAGSGPYVYVQTMVVDDDGVGQSSGDGDGQADAGETVELRLTLRNGGGAQATGVVGTLSENDPENALTIAQGSVSYGTLGAGGSSQGSGAYVVTIAADAPVAYQPALTLVVTSGQGTWPDVTLLPLRRPYLEHYSHVVDDAAPRGDGDGIVEAGEEIYYRVTLKNRGQDRATGVTGALRALRVSDRLPHPGVTVGDANASFGTLAPGQQVEGDRFAFTLGSTVDPLTLLLELTLADALGPADLQFLDVIAPVEPDTLTAFGSPSSIRLTWNRSASADARGYDVHRAPNPGGPFTRINSYTVDGTSAFEDRGLPALTRYYYRVVARDSSYNASPPTLVISGTTNPPYMPGWPIELAQQTQSSLVLSNTEGGSDYEVFTAADMQYGWHANGTEIVDGDDDDRTNGPYSRYGYSGVKGFSATAAIGDLDRNGDYEIANVGWAAESLYVWDHTGQLESGWPKWVMDDFNWPSPVLYDLDGDSDLEVILWAANGGRLFAWHHTGVEVADGDGNPATDGVLHRVFGTSFNYSSPAVADIDGDLRPEIVFCVNLSSDMTGKVYAVNHDGTLATGWPYSTGTVSDGSQITSSPAIGDLDRNGTNEIILVADRSGGLMYVLGGDGTVRPGWPRLAPAVSGQSRTSSPALGDLDGDTYLDIAYAGSDGRLYAFKRDGTQLPGFPVVFATGSSQATQSTPSIADIDGDGALEILFGDETGKVHAYHNDGTLVAGFPIQTNGEVRSTPVVWDIDQDTMTEVAVVGWDGNVYIWDLPSEFNPLRAPWPFFHHDVRNTGWMQTAPLAVGIAEPPAPAAPAAARVYPARPNPFNPATTIAFDVPGTGALPVAIAAYDVTGRLVRRLLAGPVGAGQHAITWDGRGKSGEVLGTGIYFLRIAIGEQVFTEKVALVK